jgi:hypothetical protein
MKKTHSQALPGFEVLKNSCQGAESGAGELRLKGNRHNGDH